MKNRQYSEMCAKHTFSTYNQLLMIRSRRFRIKSNQLLLKIGLLLLFFWSHGITLLAQKASPPTKDPHYFENIMLTTLLIGGVLVIVFVVLILWRWSTLLADAAFKEYLASRGQTSPVAVPVAPVTPWWKRLYKKMTQVVPIEREEEILFDHAFDGIRELDNKLPPWWVWMFYLSIGFAFIYYPYYHVFGMGDSSAEKYKKEMAAAEQAKAEYLAQLADLVDENTATPLLDEKSLAAGKTIFERPEINCVFCHGQQGEGGVGPNLTDDYWLYGGDMNAVFSSVKYGRPNGMQEWKNLLTPQEIHQVSSYILSLRGTNPPNAKAPQGELYVPKETEDVASDTTGLSLRY